MLAPRIALDHLHERVQLHDQEIMIDLIHRLAATLAFDEEVMLALDSRRQRAEPAGRMHRPSSGPPRARQIRLGDSEHRLSRQEAVDTCHPQASETASAHSRSVISFANIQALRAAAALTPLVTASI